MGQFHFAPERLESRRLLSAGDLDPSFGVGGRVERRISGTDNAEYLDGILLSNDKILLAGGAASGGEGLFIDSYLLSRFNADGTPDTSFGDHGNAIGTFPDRFASELGDITLQPDGKILAIEGGDTELARFNADGSVDTSFGTGGELDFGSELVRPIAFYPNGRFLLGREAGITRYNSDGTIDKTFAHHGVARSGLAGKAYVGVISILPNGKVLLGGGNDDSSALTRLNADGTPDKRFGDNGQVLTHFTGGVIPFITRFLFLSNGEFLAAGSAENGLAVARYGADGTLDQRYGDSGVVGIQFPDVVEVWHFQFDDQGRAVVLGIDTSRYESIVAARVNTDGSLDRTFGRVILSGFSGFPAGGGIDSHGDIVLVGSVGGGTSGDPRLLVAHLLSDGTAPSPISLDPRSHSLTVKGTSGDDGISIEDAVIGGFLVQVNNNDFGRVFTPSDVQKLSITTGNGNDNIFVRLSGTDTAMNIDAGSGNDTISAEISTSKPVIVAGGDGNDSINLADKSSPTIHGGNGNDVIKTGSGTQFLYGEGGSDTIRGGLGSDLISGGGGKDHLFGQQGKDRLYGGDGNDALDGGPGDDRLFGAAGNDKLFGGLGNDALDGGPGNDYIDAGRDNDIIVARDAQSDTLFGGRGNDSASVDKNLDVLDGIENVS